MTSEAQGKSSTSPLQTLCEAGSSMPAGLHAGSQTSPFCLSAAIAIWFVGEGGGSLSCKSCRLLFLLLRPRTCSLLSKIGSMYACSEHLQPLFHGPQSSIIVQRSSLPNRGLLRLPPPLSAATDPFLLPLVPVHSLVARRHRKTAAER